MKPFVVVLAAALVVAAAAFVLDSPVLVVVSVALFVAGIVSAFVLGLRRAQRSGFVAPFVVVLAGALAVVAIGVSAIVYGERGDAPGLVMLGMAMIVSVIVGAFALGTRSAQGSG